MTFPNRKKTYLNKLDKSKKQSLDKKLLPLITLLNNHPAYFTTSSCSGRIVLWQGSGKKDETHRLKVSHDLIDINFFAGLEKGDSLVWLRLEPFIVHVCCQNLTSANHLLQLAKPFYKKSSLLSIQNKIIVEIKGSEFLELPLTNNRQFLIKEQHLPFLTQFLNQKLAQIHQRINLFHRKLKKIKLKKIKKQKQPKK